MNHSEAVEQMAVEQYLLEELGPDARDAFEEHMFDCPECAMDVRAGVVFIDEAKRQLPKLVSAKAASALLAQDDPCPEPYPEPYQGAQAKKPRRDWFAWMRPAIMAPVFACLLGVVAYQNLAVIPGLQKTADAPPIVSLTPLHPATRGEPQPVTTTKAVGLTIPMDGLIDDGASYSSFALMMTNRQGKTLWSTTVPAAQVDATAQPGQPIPGRILESGIYIVAIYGVDAQGARKQLDTYEINLTVK